MATNPPSYDPTMTTLQVSVLTVAVSALFRSHPNPHALRAILEPMLNRVLDVGLAHPMSDQALAEARALATTLLGLLPKTPSQP